MKRQLAIGFLMSARAVSAVAQHPQDFAYGMQLEATGADALYEIVLPPAVYRHVTRADLADVRVFNGSGEMVPYAWRPYRAAESDSVVPVTLRLFPLKADERTNIDGISIHVRHGAGGESSVDVMSNGVPTPAGVGKRTVGYLVDLTGLSRALRAIALEWQLVPDGFAGRMRVDASDDLDSWSTWVEAAPLASLEMGERRLQQRRIELPRKKAKYLRLSWVPGEGSGVFPELTSVYGEPISMVVDVPHEWAQVKAEPGEGPGEYLFDLHAHYPVDRVRVELPQLNTVVGAEWLVRDRADQPWRSVGLSTVYRLRKNGQEIASPDVAVGLTAERYWLFRVDPRGGGLGSGVPVLGVGWVPRTLVFAARGKPPFQLVYGNRDAKPAAYPIAALVPGYDSGNNGMPANGAGKRQTITIVRAQPLKEQELGGAARVKDVIDWKRWSLWGSLVLGVLILGVMAWQLARRMGRDSAQ